MPVEQIIFVIILIAVGYVAYQWYGRIIYNIRLGKPAKATGNSGTRWKNTLLIAFGQKKMFKKPIPAILHLGIYTAFLLTQIELIEIILDGITGRHRIFAQPLGGLYTLVINTIEFLSVFALIATFGFLARRLILKVARFYHDEMKGWPTQDALIILGLELILVLAIFTMNGADGLLQNLQPDHYPATGHLPISNTVGQWLMADWSEATLVGVERIGWWAHVLVVFGFVLYLPKSKHLHIFFAFPNVYFAKVTPKGEMDNMPEVMKEVRIMMGLEEEPEGGGNMEELPEFGAKDINDLTWTQILSAYTCTECGRCTSQCPANITGKKLSPRKIMMDVRDRAEEVGAKVRAQSEESISAFDDGKSLFDYITPEEIHACTTCNACVEACPVMINPLDIILQLRRYEILTQSAGPGDWLPMFNSLESTGAVWQLPEEREAWIK